jgi:hypothetical protein
MLSQQTQVLWPSEGCLADSDTRTLGLLRRRRLLVKLRDSDT